VDLNPNLNPKKLLDPQERKPIIFYLFNVPEINFEDLQIPLPLSQVAPIHKNLLE
jgi:hypothetical protein